MQNELCFTCARKRDGIMKRICIGSIIYRIGCILHCSNYRPKKQKVKKSSKGSP